MNDRLKAIEIVAKNNGKGNLPPKMTMAEAFYYKSIRGVYAQYNNNAISKEEARTQKRSALDDYNTFALWEKIYQDNLKINMELDKLIQPAAELKYLSKEQLLDKLWTFKSVLVGFFGGK